MFDVQVLFHPLETGGMVRATSGLSHTGAYLLPVDGR